MPAAWDLTPLPPPLGSGKAGGHSLAWPPAEPCRPLRPCTPQEGKPGQFKASKSAAELAYGDAEVRTLLGLPG